MSFTNVSFLSIVLAAIAAWIFGGIYYTSLSKPWLAAQGKTLEQCQVEQTGKSGAAKIAPFILVFVMLLAADRKTLGPLASGPILLTIGWLSTGILVALSVILLISSIGGGS